MLKIFKLKLDYCRYIDTEKVMREQSNAADNAITNTNTKSDKKSVSNTTTTATESIFRKLVNAESPKHSRSHKYVESFISKWLGKNSNTTDQVDVYVNLPHPSDLHFNPCLDNTQGNKFKGSLKKKPKPLPKPIGNKDENYSIYVNIPDDTKLRLKTQFGNEKYVRKSLSEIYTSMDAKRRQSEGRDIIKVESNRKSSCGSLYVVMHPENKTLAFTRKAKATGFHYRGSVGCIHEDTCPLYDSIYCLKPESLRNHEYPFEKTKLKLGRLPCFCYCKQNEAREIYYSCENFAQNEVGNRSDEALHEDHNPTDINEIFEPFEEEGEENSFTKRTGRIKNIFVKKITQLTQLLVDWDTSNQ